MANLFDGFTQDDLAQDIKPRQLAEGYFMCLIEDLKFTESKAGNPMLAFKLKPLADAEDASSGINRTLRHWHVFRSREQLGDDKVARYNRDTRTLAAIFDEDFAGNELPVSEATVEAQRIVSDFVDDPEAAVGMALIAYVRPDNSENTEAKYRGLPRVSYILSALPEGKSFVDPDEIWV